MCEVFIRTYEFEKFDEYNYFLFLSKRFVDLLTNSQCFNRIFYGCEFTFTFFFSFSIPGELIIQIYIFLQGVLIKFCLEKINDELAFIFRNTTILFGNDGKKLGKDFENFFTHNKK